MYREERGVSVSRLITTEDRCTGDDVEATRDFGGFEGPPNKPSKHLSRSLSSEMALQDFTSAGISLGGIAIDAFEPSVTRTAIIAKPWIFAMMRLS
jgi:hypothetical protein